MTESEIAFLAFGLLLGATGGAAAAAVSRARGRPPREIRVTVAPAPVSGRPATLATYLDPADVLPARGGPADPAELGAEAESRFPSAARPGAGRGVRSTSGGNGRAGAAAAGATRSRPGSGPSDRTTVRISPSETAWVPIPVDGGPDPLLADLVGPRSDASARPPSSEAGGDRPRGPSEPELAKVTARTEGSPRRTAGAVAPDQVRHGGPEVSGPAAIPHGGPLPAGGPDQAAADDASGSVSPPLDETTGLDPCAGPRLLAQERCEVAARARAAATAAAERVRTARRAYDDAAAKAEAAAARANPVAVRGAKEAARDAFRVARASARSRAEAEAAARAWLDEINRINREAAAASREAARLAAAVAALGPEIERLTTEADAARIQAEAAEEACLAARQTLAECEETAAALERASHGAANEETEQPALPSGPPLAPEAPGLPPAPVPAFEDDAAAVGVEGDREAAIVRLLRGDHTVLERLVARLAGPDAEAARRWRLLLADLVDAIIARAIEANALTFPEDDPFWGRFTPAECRDIAAALASLGYRFDGLGGFVDGRVPSQRDLSLAVGYAGLDPMRIRAWPTEAELGALFSRVTITADEFLAREAGGLTLSELVELLGDRADELAEAWNAWGRLRPLLIELV